MYRNLLMAFLWLTLGNAAPKNEVNTDIPVAEIQPLIDQSIQQSDPLDQESRTDSILSEDTYIREAVTNQASDSLQDEDFQSRHFVDDLPIHEDQDSRYIRSQDTTLNYELDETTEPDLAANGDERVEELLKQTEEYESRTRAPLPPRFFSKLSYFQKPTKLERPVSRNVVQRTGKRQFRSKCRCEKISNCPKLQISVPRCPEDYFMCCF